MKNHLWVLALLLIGLSALAGATGANSPTQSTDQLSAVGGQVALDKPGILVPMADTAPFTSSATAGSATLGQMPALTPAWSQQTEFITAAAQQAATGQQAAAVAAGYAHTCALTADGGVKCWGQGGYGQLGDGTATSGLIPVDVSGLTGGVTVIAAGDWHTCAVTTSGGVKCWGRNEEGQLGDGTTTDRLTPVDVNGLTGGVMAIAAGNAHTCAVTTSGGVKCWGNNGVGQLGDGTTTDHLTPVDVNGLTGGVAAVTAGDFHTCAVTTDGGAKCWGQNNFGALGDGTLTNRLTPVDVSGLTTGVAAITAGYAHTCALTTEDGAKCWGDNYFGQLGDGTTAWWRTTPVDVSGLSSGVAAITAGTYHTCALTVGGEPKCWGWNRYGQLGIGSTAGHWTPVDVSGVASGMVTITAGGDHTCGVMISGGIKCWGAPGWLGDGTGGRHLTSVDVIGLTSGVGSIAGGGSYNCALTAGSGVMCWGSNGWGQLGDGTRTSRYIAADVSGLSSGVTSITASGGLNNWHTCAAMASGGTRCWGRNWKGQLGDGTTTDRLTPVDVSGLTSGVVDIAAGELHTCAVTTDGEAKCWGFNDYGQLGDGTTTQRLTPVGVNGLSSGVATVAAGDHHTCAVMTSGGVKCWGSNEYGQLGDGTTTNRLTPVDVSGLTGGVAVIAAGRYHTCAVTTSGGAKCWGSNMWGQLGDGTTIDRLTPVGVSGLTSGVTAIAVGGGHTCALTTGGGVMCWGSNWSGQLGDDTTTRRLTPVSVSGLTSGAAAIATGASHTCALTVSSGVKCWGSNFYGQLGINPGWTPVDVVGFGAGGTLTISHIEVNQAIQDANHTVPLVAGKRAFVRVYLDCGPGCGAMPNVTGVLRGYGPEGELPQSPLSPVNLSVTAYHENWMSQRGSLNKTLNFTIPAEWSSETITLTVEIMGAQESLALTFHQVEPIRVIYVPIRYQGELPDISRIRAGSNWANKIFPTHRIEYVPGTTFDWDACLKIGTSCPQRVRDANIVKLIKELATLYLLTDASINASVYGWLPTETLGGGRALSGRQAGIGDDNPAEGQFIFAHEVAHFMGRSHTNAGEPGSCGNLTPDPDNPWPYPTAKIQEWGIDGYGFSWLLSSDMAIKNPSTTYDYMSECGRLAQNNVWTSPWTYERIFETLQQQPFRPVAQTQSAPEIYFIVSGLVYENDMAELDPIWLVETITHGPNSSTGTDYCIEAQDEDNIVIVNHCFDLSFIDRESGEATEVDGFNLMLPYPANTARIVLRKDSQELAVQSRSANAPSVTVLSPNGGETWDSTGLYTITWSATDPDGDSLTYSVFYSQGGNEWLPVGNIITTTHLSIDAAELPGGNNGLIRVVATDGLNTSDDVSDAPFSVGTKAPQVFIISPEGEGSIRPGTPLLLQGYAFDLEDGVLDATSLHWTSSRDGNLGTGEELLASLSFGDHVIALAATDSDGNSSEVTMRIFVGYRVYLPATLR